MVAGAGDEAGAAGIRRREARRRARPRGRPVPERYRRRMAAPPVLLCTDGSEPSLVALARGLALVGPGHPVVLVTAVSGIDLAAVVGGGHAGPTATTSEAERAHAAAVSEAEDLLARVAGELEVTDAERRVVDGEVGPALCALASEVDAAALVVGSRGRGGLRRAVLGSVSDHLVRHAPCPVVVTPPLAS